MRTFLGTAVMAAAGVLGSGGGADAQVVVGTYGAPTATSYPPGLYSPGGYYAPYPGTMYSPFAHSAAPAVVPAGYYRPAYASPIYAGGYTTPYYHRGPAYTPYYGGARYGSYRRW
jgi:hypothetical protein